MKYAIVTPQIASVGDAPMAYLQRIVALVIATACLVFTFDTLYTDCRIFKVYKSRTNSGGDPVASPDFNETVTTVLNAFGDDSKENDFFQTTASLDDDEIWQESEAFIFGVTSYAVVDYDETSWLGTPNYECHRFDQSRMSPGERGYYAAIRTLQMAVPYLGITGVVLSSVELLCCNWYPTVVAGAFFLAFAGCCELTYLILFAVDLNLCFTTKQCFVSMNFWMSLFVAGGFEFSAILVLLGLRTYPFLKRRNRDPQYSRSVDANVVNIEEGLPQRPSLSILISNGAAKDAAAAAAVNGGNASSPSDSGGGRLAKLRSMLQKTQNETRDAVERATRAEAKHRAMAINMKDKMTQSMRQQQELLRMEKSSSHPTSRALAIDMNGRVTPVHSSYNRP